jgi:ADP-heptose:LPS heptosyltransferase
VPGRGDGRPRLVVLRALGLGDVLAAVPALRALAAAFPGHRRLLAAPAALAPAAAWTGAVDEVVDTAPLAPLGPALHGADVAVNLHGRGPESTRLLLATRPRRLLAFACDDPPVPGPGWDRGEHERERWCRLLRTSGIPADPGLVAIAPPGPPREVGATIVHPGAARPAVRWPAVRFAAVAAAERHTGRRVLVTGGPDEVDLARAVARAAGLPPAAVLAGRTDLDGLARLVAGAGRVVSSDTGIAHLAVACGTPTVTVFGPVDPRLWGPPPLARHRVLWAGRTGDPHAAEPFPGLLEIGVDDVLAELAALGPCLPKGDPLNGSRPASEVRP